MPLDTTPQTTDHHRPGQHDTERHQPVRVAVHDPPGGGADVPGRPSLHRCRLRQQRQVQHRVQCHIAHWRHGRRLHNHKRCGSVGKLNMHCDRAGISVCAMMNRNDE
jgi:hypothetical protein